MKILENQKKPIIWNEYETKSRKRENKNYRELYHFYTTDRVNNVIKAETQTHKTISFIKKK